MINGSRIKELRYRMGVVAIGRPYTQAEFGLLVGRNACTVSTWELGYFAPPRWLRGLLEECWDMTLIKSGTVTSKRGQFARAQAIKRQIQRRKNLLNKIMEKPCLLFGSILKYPDGLQVFLP